MEDKLEQNYDIDKIISGRRKIAYSILLYIIAYTIFILFEPLFGPFGLAALIVSVIGLLRVLSGLSISIPFRILIVVSAFIPFISLILLAAIYVIATNKIRCLNYSAGIFGAVKNT